MIPDMCGDTGVCKAMCTYSNTVFGSNGQSQNTESSGDQGCTNFLSTITYQQVMDS